MTALSAQQWLKKIHALPLKQPIKIMNVCGGHERAVTMAGLRGVLPHQVELIPGPGCPVCVCPEEDIYSAIQLALQDKVTLATFGDMLRVPVNLQTKNIRSLEQAKAAGGHIVPIASPVEAVNLATETPNQPVVFFVAGFETTIAPVAALLTQTIPDNLYFLLAGRLTYPIVKQLLANEDIGFQALIAPGHVAAVMGANQWQFVVQDYHLPTAVAGFTPETLLAAIYSVLRQILEDNIFLDNCYSTVVSASGNPTAQQQLEETLYVTDAQWRGIGTVANSGFSLRNTQLDAKQQFSDYTKESRRYAGKMPPGCDCARVVLGKAYPDKCRLYGVVCTPRTPVGPCMVSDEGACRIWWSSGVRGKS